MAECNYCTGDANDLSILHHLPTEALLAIYDLPREPQQQFQADRNDGAQAVLAWLYENGWTKPPTTTRMHDMTPLRLTEGEAPTLCRNCNQPIWHVSRGDFWVWVHSDHRTVCHTVLRATP